MPPQRSKHSKGSFFGLKKHETSVLLFGSLLLFSVLLLVLLALGILSLPIGNSPPKTDDVADLSTLKMQTDARSNHHHQQHHRDLIQSKKSSDRKQWTEVLSWEPRAFVYHNFLSKEECEWLINLAKPHMVKSTVVDSDTGKSKDSRVRTSSGTFLHRGQDKVIREIEQRIADYTFVPVEHGEGLQVLHYESGQKYEPHWDYFLDEFNTKNGGQRIATVLMYLTDVEEGGETVFPNVKVNSSTVSDWDQLSECGKTGIAVRPRMGDALLFWSMRPDATLDPMSLHAGCPVIKGNKWSSTKWMHVDEYKV